MSDTPFSSWFEGVGDIKWIEWGYLIRSLSGSARLRKIACACIQDGLRAS